MSSVLNSVPLTITRLTDYKNIDGLLIPMTETRQTIDGMFSTGREFFWNTRKTIGLNIPIDPVVFELSKK